VKKIGPEEILDLTGYEKLREGFRRQIIELKRPRRVAVGDRLTFIFENRGTVRFQIQEMIRAERLAKPEAIQAELDVYNELIPADFELSATLMIEIPDQALIRQELDRLIGIDEYVWLDIGQESVRATFDPKQFEEDRISAVQYVRFPLGRGLAARFADRSVPASLRVEHPSYRATTPLEGATRTSLARDLEPEE
jgi:hypothetical protein